MDWLNSIEIMPDMLDVFDVYLLVGLSFFTSLLTAAVGIGGGMLLLAVMAQILPVPAIVPVHGVVQLGSNAGRAFVMRPNIDGRIFLYFLGGSIVGAILGGQIVVTLPVMYLQLILAAFILFSTWGPKPSSNTSNEKGLMIGGFFSTLLTMFVGATGPFVAVMLKRLGLGKLQQVATMAACMTVQHVLKVVVFAALGFAFGPYLPLMALMIATGFLGTLTGRLFLDRLSEKTFSTLLKWALTLLAFRLFWKAFVS